MMRDAPKAFQESRAIFYSSAVFWVRDPRCDVEMCIIHFLTKFQLWEQSNYGNKEDMSLTHTLHNFATTRCVFVRITRFLQGPLRTRQSSGNPVTA